MNNNEFQVEENTTLNLTSENTEIVCSNRKKKPYHPPTLSAPMDMVKTTRFFLQTNESGQGLQGRQLEK